MSERMGEKERNRGRKTGSSLEFNSNGQAREKDLGTN